MPSLLVILSGANRSDSGGLRSRRMTSSKKGFNRARKPRRYKPAFTLMAKLAVLLILAVLPSLALAGPIFPTRGFLVHPQWYGKTDTTAIFDHAGYWAQVQRGFGSDSDRWGWSVSMGAIWDFALWGGDKSLFALAGM